MKRLIVIGVVVSLMLVSGSVAKAGGFSSYHYPVIGPLVPFNFGLGALAIWARGAGEPGCLWDFGQFGLYLQKGTATNNYAAAGAEIKVKNLKADKLTALSFDISGTLDFTDFNTSNAAGANGYCGAGAPRFNVASTGGFCFLGCIYGQKTQDTVTGWWTIKFTPPFTQYPGCTAVSGDILSLTVIMDEGIDVGPGNVVLDNITVNDKVFVGP